MKTAIKSTGLLMILLSLQVCINAQTLEESLGNTLHKMDSVKTVPEMISISAQLDMIADKWNNEWISNYYAGFAKAILSFMVQDAKKKDLYLDEADKFLAKTKSIKSESDETYVLAALITNARIAVDGQNRGMQYGGAFNQLLEKAKSINPDNPRIYYLKGTSLFYQPEMFGGGKDKAKPLFEKAKELFAKEEKTSVLKPSWGERENENYLKQCDEK